MIDETKIVGPLPFALKLEVGCTTITLDPDHPNYQHNLDGLSRMQLRILDVLLDEIKQGIKHAILAQKGIIQSAGIKHDIWIQKDIIP